VLHVFLTDVSDYYVLVADGLFIYLFFFLLFLFPLLLTSVIILIICNGTYGGCWGMLIIMYEPSVQ